MRAGTLAACVTGVATLGAVLIGESLWWGLSQFGIHSVALTAALTAVLVTPPLAGLLTTTVAWARRQDDALRNQEQMMRRHETLLVSAQRLAKLGYWRWTVGADHFSLSEEVCSIYGVPVDDPRLSMERLFEIMHPDDRLATREAIRILFEQHRHQEIEYRVRGADGKMRTVWVDGRCEYDAQGNAISVFGVIQDITERKAIENDLRMARDKAEIANRAKSEFLASMSHELRTPLNAILGFSETIRDQLLGPVGNARYAEYAGDIHNSGTHLLGLIEGLLDLAKIEAGRYELHEEQVELCAVVDRAIRMAQPIAAKKGQTIELLMDRPGPVIRVDERALRQILLNLLSNAFKFSEWGSPVIVRASCEPSGIVIEVEDRGIGIPEDKLAEIGTPFFQAHAGLNKRFGGTGIGLSVTRSLVELHGGSFALVSRSGVGTRVTIRLPASRVLQRSESAT